MRKSFSIFFSICFFKYFIRFHIQIKTNIIAPFYCVFKVKCWLYVKKPIYVYIFTITGHSELEMEKIVLMTDSTLPQWFWNFFFFGFQMKNLKKDIDLSFWGILLFFLLFFCPLCRPVTLYWKTLLLEIWFSMDSLCPEN